MPINIWILKYADIALNIYIKKNANRASLDFAVVQAEFHYNVSHLGPLHDFPVSEITQTHLNKWGRADKETQAA